MKGYKYQISNKQIEYQSYFSQKDSPCIGTENVSIIVHKKKNKKRNKNKMISRRQYSHCMNQTKCTISTNQKQVTRYTSMPHLVKTNNRTDIHKINIKRSNLRKNPERIQSKYVVNVVSEHGLNESLNTTKFKMQTKFKVYRCQIVTKQETCCCSCNSDAMFEVMKSLYDCYKRKNCDHCNCILCGHLPREERRKAEVRKSLEAVGIDISKIKKQKEETKKAEKAMEGKTLPEKEKILKDLAKTGAPLPKGKTESEKALIQKVRKELGIPPEPKTASEKIRMKEAAAVGALTPLEGKTKSQKERILETQADMGIPLPEGRTSSEKALIEKIKRKKEKSKEKIRKAKAPSLLTSLEGKSPEEKEKILRGRAMQGLPLPEGKTASEKKLINKVRADLGLPPEPKTSAMKEKYAKAAEAGLMQPLEGKTPKEKEKILRGLAEKGIPLPEGRTPSEKALVTKVIAEAKPPSKIPTEKIRKAKAEGLLTPLKDKTPEEKERILRGLAKEGLPLPEAKTASEKKLTDKIRKELGLPPEPTTATMREKHEKAAAAGVLVPLEGLTPAEKEKVLKKQADLGISLPEGRTASEKALIAKVKAEAKRPTKIPSEKIRKAKAEGLITPLEGKAPEEKERILRGLAKEGLPLPEAKTASEKKLTDKIRKELGLPPEPKTASMKEKHEKAAAAGALVPLQGLSPEEKEDVLRKQAELGILLPEGRTASEKALIAKVKAEAKPPTKIPSEKVRKAKAAGLITPLEGKKPEEKEKILRGLAKEGLPLPEAKTESEKKLTDKIRKELGLPPEPKTASMKEKHEKAAAAGALVPLEGLTPEEKEEVLRKQAELGVLLPEGRTASEKALIAKVKAEAKPPSRIPSEKMRKAKAAGLITPLEGKKPEEKERILRGLAKEGLPLPEAKTSSEKKLTDKIRKELGLPPEPKTASMKEKHEKAAAAGALIPLEGLTPEKKEELLRKQAELGIPLPEGRTPSEKALIAKVKAEAKPPSRIPSEKLRKAKEAGLITPLEGKKPEEKEKILRGLAMEGLPLPEANTSSEKKLTDKIRKELGLPPEPKTASMRDKHEKAAAAGALIPLEGLTPAEKEEVLRKQADLGIPLPEGRTPTEKALIAKVKAEARPPSRIPSEKMRKAKAAGLITPLEGKKPEEKERILRGLAKEGLPLPEAKTSSEKKLADKIRKELGLPPEPKTASMKEKHEKAAATGALVPMEGLTPTEKEEVLRKQAELGITLPEGRTPSEKALIAKVKAEAKPPSRVPSEKMRKAKEAGLITPLAGKKPEEKEKILRGLAKEGLPLPEAKTSSEKKLMDKIRKELGLPPEPKTASMREKHEKAAAAGALVPLEGLTPAEKEDVLKKQAKLGIPLPEGRTPTEKALIAKVRAEARPPSRIPSEKMRKAKAAGLITPLEGKKPEEKERILRGLAKEGLPLPEAKTSSEKKLTDKIRKELGLPPEPKTASMKEKHEKAAAAGALVPLEGLTPAEKKEVLRKQAELGITLPEGRTPSEKALIAKVKAEAKPPSRIPSEKIRKAKEAGLITPLAGKKPEEKEKILRGLAKEGLPLPEAKTSSEKKLTDKIRKELGLPPEPKTASMKEKHEKAAAAGALVPLEGLTPAEKEEVLRKQADLGIPLPEGRTPTEKALIAKVKAEARPPSRIPSEKMRKAKAAGLITPLEGKKPEEKERILRGLAKEGLPLPEAKTSSEKKLTDKIRKELGLPPEPKTASMKEKHEKAAAAGALVPLEGLTPAEKEEVLRKQAELGIPLPEGRTPTEKALIAKVKAEAKPPSRIPSEKLRKAKEAGLITPLEGKKPEEKDKILRGLAKEGLPLPEAKTSTERKLTDKIRKELGLPPEPKTASMRKKHEKAAAAGALVPLEGLTPAEKEEVLRKQAELGIPLPEGRTPTEKALIAKVKAEARPPSRIPSEKIRKAKEAGLITPLAGKKPEEKEKILRGLAKEGLPLPEAKTSSEKKLTDKIRKELGLPPEPKTASMKERHEKAAAAGALIPLEGLTPAEKEEVLKKQAKLGIPLPEGRTPSEKALIAKVKAEARPPSRIPSEKLRKAKAAGLITPLEGKKPEEKEKILRGLAKEGLPLPEAKTASEKILTDKIRKEVGLPPEPKTASMKDKHEKAAAAGALVPLEGLSPAEKEEVLRKQAELGIPLPEGRTPTEKALIAKIKTEAKPPSRIPSEKLRKAKAAGLITPLEGKKPEEKEKILRGLAKEGLPLPEAKTASEKILTDKIRKELGLPPEPKTASMKDKHEKAAAAGALVPLEGLSPAAKEEVLRKQAELGIPLPEGRTPTEKALIAKIKAEAKPPSRIPSEKLRKAKAAGLITPLEGKKPEEKEKILRGLAKEGLPLPEAKTASEKILTDKIRKELGLPPEPKTASMKDKHEKAAAVGALVPLEGLSPAEKEEVLRKQAELGIPLPEGRTPTEKALIAKIKAEAKPPSRIPSEKLRKAKAAGLITPLEGKKPEEKEKILRGLAKEGLPLPEAKTASERILTDKIRKELGLPPEPKTASVKDKHEKAAAAGALVPLEGLSPAEKEEVLRKQAELGIPLPEGRTPTEKALIAKIKAEAKPPSRIPSEKLRKAKAAGLITPLEGKKPEEKERILKGLAKEGLPLPEAKTASEKILTDKIRKELGLPPEPATASMKAKHEKAAAVGALVPLEGLSPAEKEKVLKKQAELGILLPEGRTSTERALIHKVKARAPSRIISEKIRKAKAAGLLTPLEGKKPEEKERILRGLAKQGLPLPEAKTASEKILTDKIRKELGLPPEPTTASMKEKHRKVAAAGALVPLEGLSPSEKVKVLKQQADLGITLPEGRTATEKALIAKVKAEAKAPSRIPSEKIRKAKAAGLITPLEGKKPEEKERILRGLAKEGLPLPEAKTSSEKKMTDKIRKELGLPPEPKTASMKDKYEKAAAAGALVPLEGLSPEEKERVLKKQAELGIPLPEGRTPTEKALIAKVKAEAKPPSRIPSEKLRKAKAAGLITPLEGKKPEDKERILRGLAKEGLPLPEAKTASDKILTDKIRKELGLPPEPTTASMKEKHEKAAAAGALIPLEGLSPEEKEKVLKKQAELGIPLPEGRTPTEKALIAKVKAEAKPPSRIPSEKLRKAKEAGLITPLEGKTPEEKEKILRGLAKEGLPLPEAKTTSERKLTDKIRKELGLPPEPTTASMKEKHEKAAAAGALVPLEGLSLEEKEAVLKKQAALGISLPEGRTASEKALIAKVKAKAKAPSRIPSEKIRKAKAAGLITPLEGKKPEEKERILRGLAKEGLPLPEAKTASEKKLTDKIRKELGLPPEPTTASMKDKHEKAAAAGALVPLEGLSPEEKEKVLKKQAELGITLPEGRTASEKALIDKIKAETKPPVSIKVTKAKLPSEKLRKAKALGLFTPLQGKSPEEKERIMKGLAMQGLPIPEGRTASEKKIAAKVRRDLGLPPEPSTESMRDKHDKAAMIGALVPLEGLAPKEKEKVLKAQAELGIPLPEGRTASEKSLIAKVKAEVKPPSKILSEKLRKAKAAGLLTPLEGKTPEEKENILRGLAKQGLPLPEPKTASDKKLTDKIRKEMGLPPEPTTTSMRKKHEKAAAIGALVPLEGLSPAEKEKLLKKQADLGIPLPEGRTPSEKALIAKIKAEAKPPSRIPSEKIREAKAAGLITPLEGKTPEEKERILRGLAKEGLPLPEAKTSSERKLSDKIRKELGLPPEPTTASMKDKHEKAAAAGALIPLDGLSPEEKEKVLKTQAELGIPLPEGRTASEKALIAKVKAEAKPPSRIPSEKIRKAKAEGLITPLTGKPPEEKERILRGLAAAGLPLPEAKTASEKKLTDKIRKEVGLPPEPATASMRAKHEKAAAAGALVPLEGLTPAEKEKVLKTQAELGITLPEGRTASEKALIAKVKAEAKPPSRIPSEKIRKAKAEGLITRLTGKPPEEKERILRGLAAAGLPLPEAKTASEKKLSDKIRKEMGLPPEPKTASMKERHEKAAAAGALVPLEGLTPEEKEKVLKTQADLGIPLPEGRTASEKALIAKIKAEAKPPSRIPSEKIRKAKAEGLITTLTGKPLDEKERILRGLAAAGLPMPEAKTASEKKLSDKIRKEMGLPPEPKTASMKEKHEKAAAAGALIPLEGLTPAEKEKVLKTQADLGIPLPEGRTPSEKALIAKIRAEAKPPSRIPSEKLRKAKEEGLLTELEGKAPEDKDRILKGLAKAGLPLPEPKTASERKLADKVRKEMGLPPEPTTASMKAKHEKAAAAGGLVALEGLSPEEKEKVLKTQAELGIPLPEGRTSSEKALIAKVKAEAKRPSKIPSEKIRKAKAEGLITTLAGKPPEEKERILRGLAAAGLPLPEAKTASEKKISDQIRKEMGLPPEPKTASMKEKHEKAAAAGALIPLEGLTPAEKEKVLKTQADLGIPLPEGRTPSEKALIAKFKAEAKPPSRIPSEKLRKAKEEGLLTVLEGKAPEDKERILRGLAKAGLPLPEPKTASERKLADKVRKEMGLPPEPTTASMKAKHDKAAAAGGLVALEGLSPEEKEKVLRTQADLGIPLPEGRTATEKALIAKIKAEAKPPSRIPSEKLRKAKKEGLLTVLEGKAPEEKEKILRGLAKAGLPLPEPKTASERKLADKVRKEMGLPPEPTTPSMKAKHEKAAAAGGLVALEGLKPEEKEKVLRTQADLGIPLPEGRTATEKALIAKIKAEAKPPSRIPSEKLRKAKEEGLLTTLEGKAPEDKEKILRGLAKAGLPLPEPKTASEKMLADKVRKEMGLPPEPTTPSMKAKHEKAAAAGGLVALEGLSPEEKEKVLRTQADLGIPLPEGRTKTEKSLIAKIKAEAKAPSRIPSAKLRKAKEEGLLTTLEGKAPEDKEKILRGLAKAGLPLPEPKTASEKMLADKVRKEMGLPPEPTTPSMKAKHEKAAAAGGLVALEGLSPEEKEKVLRKQADLGIPLPEARTKTEKSLIAKIKAEAKPPPRIPSEKLRKAKEEGLLTTLEGKVPEDKEKILRGLAKAGLPLPEPKTASEKMLADKVRKEMGLPPEPTTPSMKAKHEKAAAAGGLVALEGLTPEEKEKVLRTQADLGIPLPEGRTATEKALIAKIKAEAKPPSRIPSEKLRKAKEEGLLTVLEGKAPEDKEKILRGLAKAGLPLPEAKTESEKKISDKIRKELGLPPEPATASMKDKHQKAAAAGALVPLEGLSPAEKEEVLRKQADLGIILPEGRTPSEKALIAKVKAEAKPPSKIPSEKVRKAKAEGLLTPLEGKTPEEKEKILRGLAKEGLPLPEAKTASEKKLTDKIRKDLGLPPEPTTPSMKEKHQKAAAAGVLVPLEGLSPAEKEEILKKQAELGILLPEGRTPSEKALIAKVKAEVKPPSKIPSEKFRKAIAAGLLTPLEGKTPEEKEKILRGLAKQGLPLPEAKTASEKKLIDKVRKDMGLPPEPMTASMKSKHRKAAAAGALVPLEGLTPAQKEEILRQQAELGVPLPEGRTPSEKALIAKVKAEAKVPPKIPSEKLRKAIASGLLTPLEGKTPKEKERILRGLAKHGLPLPEAKTASEKILTDKIRKEMGLPPEPTTASMKSKHHKAAAAGALIPLEGLTPAEKAEVLKKQAALGMTLPEGRTPSEKALIAKVKAEAMPPSRIISEKIRKAKAAGLLTPLEGKKPEDKERILRGLAKQGIPLPEAKTASEKKLIEKIRKDMGLPPEPTTASMKDKHVKAAAAGALVPLEGLTPAEKEKVLKKQADLGIILPEGRTASEKGLIAKVKAEAKAPSRIPSAKLRKAKEEGLLTGLEGKAPEDKERILRGLAKAGLPLPEPKTPSERKLADKVRKEMGLPPEPTTPSMKAKHEKAAAAGGLVALEGLTPDEKEKVLRTQADLGIPLPEGRTATEKALIAKIKAKVKPPSRIPSEKLRKAKEEGLLTVLEGKAPEDKERILKGLAKAGLPLPEPKTASERKLADKVRKDMGLPPEPTTPSMKAKHEKAAAAGGLVALEGLTPAEKEKVLRTQADLGIPLPEGRTATEKALIAKIKAEAKPPSRIPSAKLRKAKEEGLLTVLEGKAPEDKERILKGLAKAGLPLPEPKTASERKLADKVRKEMGLPPEPTTPSMKAKHEKAAAAGALVALEGLTPEEKEKVLKTQAELGIPLPEGRTATEKALIEKIKAEAKPPSRIPSEKLRKAKEEGLLTVLEGKAPEDKERILKGLAKAGLPLPEPKTASERKLADKVRKEMGLPPEPTTPSMKAKHEKAAAAGALVALEGLSPEEKEKVLKTQAELGIPLPEGRTATEKALIEKIKAETKPPSRIPPEKLRKAKEEGLLTVLEGKAPEDKERILKGLAKAGLPLPEPKTASERKLADKVRKEMGLPPEPTTPSMKAKHEKAAAAGALVALEGLTPEEKEKVLKTQAELGIPLPEGRTATEKALIEKIKAEAKPPSRIPSEKLRKAKEEGLLTTLEGKAPEDKEKILRGLAKAGLPFPEPKTASEKMLADKIRKEMGLPPEPTTPSMKAKHEKAAAAGGLVALEGLTPEEKEEVLRTQADLGIPLPEGRTKTEKSLIAKIKAEAKPPSRIPSEKLRRAKEEGLLTTLEGKAPEDKEKILRGLAKSGLPLPEPKTASEKMLGDKIRKEMGLPPEPTTPSMKAKHEKAAAAGALVALEGLSPEEKEKVLRTQADLGIPLPEGRTKTEKSLIAKIKAEAKPPSRIPSEKLRKAKEEGLLTTLEGKAPEDKEKILRGLAKAGLPLPEPKTASERKLADKVRKEMGLPPEPTTPSMKAKHEKAAAAGGLVALEGLTPEEKEKVLRTQAGLGIPLPEGRTKTEKSLIAKIKAEAKPPSRIPTEKLRKAKEEGLLTTLEGKAPEDKEKILRGLAKAGLPFPEPKTASEKMLADKVRKEMGLPPEPTTPSMKAKHEKAAAAGGLVALEGLTPEEKEKVLRTQADLGIPLPEGRTKTEKSLIAKIKAEAKPPSRIPSEKLRRAKEEGLLTTLEGKAPEDKEKILRGLAKAGLPFPEPKTASEKMLADKVRKEMGLPPEPTTPSMKAKHEKAAAAGGLVALEGLTPEEKEKVLRTQADLGIPLPEGRTKTEKSLIAKIKAEAKPPSRIPSEKLRRAKEEGLLTTLEGKAPEDKEKIFRGLAKAGLPLPEPKTASEKMLADKVRKEMGLPPEPTTPSMKAKHEKAAAAGGLVALEGLSPEEKEKVLRTQADLGIPLPEGRTKTEKSLIAKIKAEAKPPSRIPSEKLRKAKAAGLLTPLEGKPKAEKERIIRGLAEEGLPLPEGKTPSEKSMIKKVKKELGIPEKKIKTRSIKSGLSKKTLKAIGVGVKGPPLISKAGIAEELEEIEKTTTCDRACGCDKKKIKFKHSYVKIRVTSPDISSLCPCPDECIPGVKGGVFVDNEGIKVTVGSAVGVPSYSNDITKLVNDKYKLDKGYRLTSDKTLKVIFDYSKEINNLPKMIKHMHNYEAYSDNKDYNRITKLKDISDATEILDSKTYLHSCGFPNKKIIKSINSAECNQKSILKKYDAKGYTDSENLSLTKLKSFSVITNSEISLSLSGTDTSLSLMTSNESAVTISLISLVTCNSDYSDSARYICYSISDDSCSNPTGKESERARECFIKNVDYYDSGSMTSEEFYDGIRSSNNDFDCNESESGRKEFLSYQLPPKKLKKTTIRNSLRRTKNGETVIILNNLKSGDDIRTVVDNLLLKKKITATSSIFVVVPTSDDDDDLFYD